MDVTRLKTLPLFSGLSNREPAQVETWIDEVDLPPGRKLLGEGTLACEFVIIEDGTASVTIDGVQVNTLGPGDFFGEIALLATPRRTSSVETTSQMRAGVMNGPNFREMIRELPQVAERVREAMEARMHTTGEAPA